MTTGEQIKNYRIKQGLTQRTLGESCGIAESTIRRYELGSLNPKIETLKKIADVLGLNISIMGERIYFFKKKSNFYEVVDELLKAHNISRRCLAIKIDIPPTTFQSMFSRHSEPTLNVAIRISHFFNVPLEIFDMLEGDERWASMNTSKSEVK